MNSFVVIKNVFAVKNIFLKFCLRLTKSDQAHIPQWPTALLPGASLEDMEVGVFPGLGSGVHPGLLAGSEAAPQQPDSSCNYALFLANS